MSRPTSLRCSPRLQHLQRIQQTPFRRKAMTMSFTTSNKQSVTRDARKVLEGFLRRSQSNDVPMSPDIDNHFRTLMELRGRKGSVDAGGIKRDTADGKVCSFASSSSSQESGATALSVPHLPTIQDSPVLMRREPGQLTPPPSAQQDQVFYEADAEEGAVNWRAPAPPPAAPDTEESVSPASSRSSSLNRSTTNWKVQHDSVASDSLENFSRNPSVSSLYHVRDHQVAGSSDPRTRSHSTLPHGGTAGAARKKKKSLYKRTKERLEERFSRQNSAESLSGKRVSRDDQTDEVITSLVQTAAKKHVKKQQKQDPSRYYPQGVQRGEEAAHISSSSPESSKHSTMVPPVRRRKRKKRLQTGDGAGASPDSDLTLLERLFFSFRKPQHAFLTPASAHSPTPVLGRDQSMSTGSSPVGGAASSPRREESDGSTSTPPLPPPPPKTAKKMTKVTKVFRDVLDKAADKSGHAHHPHHPKQSVSAPQLHPLTAARTGAEPPRSESFGQAPLAKFSLEDHNIEQCSGAGAGATAGAGANPGAPVKTEASEEDIELVVGMLDLIARDIENMGFTNGLPSLVGGPPAPSAGPTTTAGASTSAFAAESSQSQSQPTASSGETFQLEEALQASRRRFKFRHQHGPVSGDHIPELTASYSSFSSCIERLLAEEEEAVPAPCWHSISQLFVLTRQACRLAAVQQGESAAEHLKEYSMRFFSDRYAQWVVGQGGWRAVVEETEDSELD